MINRRRQQKQKNSVTKIYPHVGKTNYYYYYYFFGLITTRIGIRVKVHKKFCSRWGSFLVTPLSILSLVGERDDDLN